MKKVLASSGVAILLAAALSRGRVFGLLFSANYLPHRVCYLTQPGLIWTNSLADSLIAASYGVIFFYLLTLAARLRSLPEFRPYLWIFTCFGLFIGACGATHVMEVITVWWPVYPFAAGVKVLCAAASLPTAILFAAAAPGLMRRIPLIIEMFTTTQRERDQARAELMAWGVVASERERAEAIIREAYERMNHIMDSTSEGIFKLRSDWTVHYANRQALSWDDDLGLEKNYWECYPSARGTIIEEKFYQAMHEKIETEFENFWEPADEWFSVHCYPVDGGISVFFSKVTERKRLEQELKDELQRRQRGEKKEQEAKEQLNHILDSTSEGILKLDPAWRILYGNRKAHEISQEVRVGMNFWECFPALQGTSADLSLHKTMNEQVETSYEVYYPPYDEWFRVKAFPTPRGLSLFYHAITAEKKLQEQLDRERRLREKRIEALSNMAGGLAHEISNPLAIIHGTASDLQRLAMEEPMMTASEVLKGSETIVQTSERAMRILRGLRGFAREAGKDPMEDASIYQIVEQAVQMQEARFARHGISLTTRMPPDIPMFPCRETQVGQIVTNLVNNAFDAIVERECSERWVVVEAGCDGRWVQVDVVDSGFAIDETVRERLMDPFFTTKTRGLGMGVGLSLSRAIAIEHGGSLELCSGPGSTRFRLRLPLEPVPAEHEPEHAGAER